MSKFNMTLGNVITFQECRIDLRNVSQEAFEIIKLYSYCGINMSAHDCEIRDKGYYGSLWFNIIASSQLKIGDVINISGVSKFLDLEIVYIDIRGLKMFAAAEQKFFIQNRVDI